MPPSKIICIGEILWDSLPEGLFPGGAPFNVACHLQQLGQNSSIISRIGNDELGKQLSKRAKGKGVSTQHIQSDKSLPTGIVNVDIDSNGIPAYEIVQPSAWDAIENNTDLQQEVVSADILVFGSLAQRSDKSRETISNLADLSPTSVFDVNLRPPFLDKNIVRQSLLSSQILKLNTDELLVFSDWFSLSGNEQDRIQKLANTFDLRIIALTRGDKGAALLYQNNWYEHPGFRISVIDTVGSGDAFLAMLINKVQNGANPKDILIYANALGAMVAGKSGATPFCSSEEIDSFIKHAK